MYKVKGDKLPIFDKYKRNNGIPIIAQNIVVILPNSVVGVLFPYPANTVNRKYKSNEKRIDRTQLQKVRCVRFNKILQHSIWYKLPDNKGVQLCTTRKNVYKKLSSAYE